MLVVGGKLMIDGVDVHAVMFLIALMFYNGYSRTVGPNSSLARDPPINEGFKCTRYEVSPI
jgi:hypothetical protein